MSQKCIVTKDLLTVDGGGQGADFAILRQKNSNFNAILIISDKFDDKFVPYKASGAVQALKVCPVRPRVLSSWGITLLEKLRAADES